MPANKKISFATITTKGALFPVDFLEKLAAGDRNLDGLTPESYYLNENEKLNEAISRSWKNVLGYWKNFQSAKSKLSATDRGTSETREKWLLPLFKELGYGRLLTSEKFQFDGKDYPVSHIWNKSPIHLISFKAPLDEKSDIIGARRTSPHAMVQDLLNRSNDLLWAFLSNGHQLRILRDNRSLTKQAYIEFDLETMLNSEVYSDFVVLWLLCHQSRVEAEIPEQCWLEIWTRTSREQGIRALDSMRQSVENAIESLGIGFIENKYNSELRTKLRDGTLSVQDYYRQLLRIVYRFLFLFTAEDRDLLHSPDAPLEAKEIYIKYYSASRLREIAQRSKGTFHNDLWELIKLIFEKLGSDIGCKELALPAWGGFLWKKEIVKDIIDCKLSNRALLSTIRSLAFTIDEQILRAVDYKNLGAEELGSVYEALLELNPKITLDPPSFSLETLAGSERKTTGSYYTPDSLVQSLLETALEPVLTEALKSKNPEQALLSLKICDPAMGSGHFLIAAAHRTAKKLAAVRTGEDEPSPNALQHALRDVISNCVYGVDINPMAVELCKFSLWLEALEPGMPLSFIDHHIKCGNSLLGTTPALMRNGIPNEAFKPIEGDDKDYCSEWKKVNKKERETQTEDLFRYSDEPWKNLGNLAINITQIIDIPNDSIENIHQKEKKYAELVNSQGYEFGKLLADAWCASFVWKKTKEFPYPITEEVFRKIEKNPHSVPKWMKDEIKRLSEQYQFFHWHLEFPDVFQVPPSELIASEEKQTLEQFNPQTGWLGGFDVVLGNPPWEKLQPEEVKFFAGLNNDISNEKDAKKRKELIKKLAVNDNYLYKLWVEYQNKIERISRYIIECGLYRYSAKGNINLYKIFTDLSRTLINANGMCGIISQSGILTDDLSKEFFYDLISRYQIHSIYDFINTKKLFDIDSRIKFCLITLTKMETRSSIFKFNLVDVDEIKNKENEVYIRIDDIELINPNTKNCPLVTDRNSFELIKNIYSKSIILKSYSPAVKSLNIDFWGEMFNMTRATKYRWDEINENINLLPLYESKYFHQFDPKFAAFNDCDEDKRIKGVTNYLSISDKKSDIKMDFRFYVNEEEVLDKCRRYNLEKKWVLAFRSVTSATNERTIISAILPRFGMSNSINIALTNNAELAAYICFCCNTFLCDFIASSKVGNQNLNIYIIEQLPLYDYSTLTEGNKKFIKDRLLELIYFTDYLKDFANDYSYFGQRFIWDEERRFIMRCELDALYFHLYEIERDDVDYIMETFPIVKRKDEEKYGEYRTKRVILEIYDEMAECKKNGTQYQTKLDPPPADQRVAHKE
uniref:site-specific DNA-methyltransferase (adenine-specific) n=1 Tax=Ignavibacterium album TaxID=591197 RepID=A0A7V2ZKH4_9BACT